MQELTQVTNVGVVLGIVVGIVVGLTWAVPRLAGIFKSTNGTNGKPSLSDEKHRGVRHAASTGPDPCADCRTEVHDVLRNLEEHRSEEKESKERILRAHDRLTDVLQRLDQTIREFVVEQRTLRQTGDGIRVPRIGRSGGEK